MEFLAEYALFFAKIATFLIAIVALLIVVKMLNKGSDQEQGQLEVTDLTDTYKNRRQALEAQLHDETFLKARDKQEKKENKAKKKEAKKELKEGVDLTASHQPHLFVLDFKGSIDAKEVASLREEISAILAVANEQDEVLVRLETGGGMVHGYGLASSQLDRLKQANIPLTVAVDKVAASGGYMMACVADKIISAPFAIIGSIGVIAQIPNFNKLLKKHDVEYEQMTAGEYKRTLTMFGENTDKAREKFKQELELTHELFKDFIREHRPELELEKVATGEHWFGKTALELGLVDEINTSDDLIQAACKDKKVLKLHFAKKKKLTEKFAGGAAQAVDSTLLKLVERGQKPIL